MKTTVVCGMLGAGKTTFIQHLAKNAHEKMVVLVNDFGKLGIDGEILSSRDIESIELPSGCVCCTLKFDLITTIQKVLKEYSPDHLVIEPSGVASPSGVLEVIDLLKIAPVTVIGIIDATEFLELYESGMYGAFFEDQVVTSDVVLVNKTDLADSETVLGIEGVVEALNPRALLIRTVNAALKEPVPMSSHNQGRRKTQDIHLHFDTVSLKIKDALPRLSVEELFRNMAEGLYGTVVRAKALVQTDSGSFRFDLSYGKIDAVPLEKAVTDSRLVIIGENLQRDIGAPGIMP